MNPGDNGKTTAEAAEKNAADLLPVTDTPALSEEEHSAGTLQQLRLLADLSQEFAQSLNIDDTLDLAVQRIADYMDAEAASVFLLEDDKLVCRASFGPVDLKGMAVDSDVGLVGKTLTTGQCQIIRDARSESDFSCYVDELTGFCTRSVLCTPLKAGDEKLGVLQILNKQDGESFTRRDRDVLRVLASPIALAIHNAKLALDLVEQKRLRKELTLARRLQRSLLPPRQPPPFPIVGSNLPAHEVSGDFYDYFALGDDCYGFVIGDVSGKGLDASMLMVRTASLLRWLGKDRNPPGEWLKKANDELCETTPNGLFVCAAAGYYLPREDRVVWANAGLPPALLREADGRIQEHIAGAPPLGIVPELSFLEESVFLGDRGLYFVTDGLTDARDAKGQPLGMAGLRTHIGQMQADTPEIRIGKLIAEIRRQQLKDDSTVLLIEKRDNIHEEELGQLRFEVDPANLKTIRHKVEEVASALGFGADDTARLVLAIDEAVTNLLRHAYKGDTSGLATLRFKRQNNTLVIYLRDYAPDVYDNSIKPRDLSQTRPGGLGINFIDTVMDSWEFATPKDGFGNLLIMKKEIPARRQACLKPRNESDQP